MERGVSVDAVRYWPVMVELGLHASPSLEGPGENELPGAWLRDLRQSSGIAPERLCAASLMSEHDSALSRTTLARIEQGTNRKPIRLGTLHKIAHAFEQCRVPLQASVPVDGVGGVAAGVAFYLGSGTAGSRTTSRDRSAWSLGGTSCRGTRGGFGSPWRQRRDAP